MTAFETTQTTWIDVETGDATCAGALRKLAEGFAGGLRDAGIGSGDRVGVSLANGARFPALLVAALRIGANPVLLHPDAPVAELCRLAGTYGAGWVVAEAHADRKLDIAEWRGLASHSALRVLATEHWARDARLVGVPMHPTSGTTGKPKLALRPGHSAIEEARHYCDALGIGSHDRILVVSPMSHAYAYGFGVMVSLESSATILSMRTFHPRIVGRILSDDAVTLFPATPGILRMLLRSRVEAPLTAPRHILSAGAPCPRELASAIAARAGRAIRPLYGTTETGAISIAVHCDAFDGSVGPPMRGVEVKLRTEADRSAHGGDADMATLAVRSSSLMTRYDGAGVIELGPDGYFDTGDLARIGAGGEIHLYGRRAQVINVHGFKVLPAEVEKVISALPEVSDVHVYAGQRGDDRVVCAAIAMDPPSEQLVREHCTLNLSQYKHPARIAFFEALPRSPLGKILASELPYRFADSSAESPRAAAAQAGGRGSAEEFAS